MPILDPRTALNPLLAVPDQPRTPFWADAGALVPQATNVLWEAPADAFSQWDSCSLGNDPPIRIPGLVTVTADKQHRLDKKSSPGTTNATLTHLGSDLAEVEIHIRMWTPAHLEAYAKLVDWLIPRTGTPPQPVDVTHPGLALHRIASLYIKSAPIPRPSSIPGVFETSWRLTEFNPSKKKALASPKGSTQLKDVSQVQIGTIQRPSAPSKNNTGP